MDGLTEGDAEGVLVLAVGDRLVGANVESRTGGLSKGRIVGLGVGPGVAVTSVGLALSDGALLKMKVGISEVRLGMVLGTILGHLLGCLLGLSLGRKLCSTLGRPLGPPLGAVLG